MSDLLSPVTPDPPYLPNPSAARLLSRLIETGYAPEELPALPPEWQAFVEAVHGFPYAMIEEVNAVTEHTLDRAVQDRILYKTLDALHDPPVLEWCVDRLFVRPSLNLLVGDPGTRAAYALSD